MPDCAVLWDMDGVLADSTEMHFLAWQAILAPRGIRFSREIFTRTYGQNNRTALTDFLGRPPTESELHEIATAKESWFRQHLNGGLTLLPGVYTWLRRFQSWGLPQAVASSAPPENITAQVDALRIRPFFGALVSGADIPGKPDPAVFLKAASQLGVAPQGCLVIEDAPAGVAGARRAGMKCAAVLTTQPAEALQAADLVVHRLTDLGEADARRLLNLPAVPPTEHCPVVRRVKGA